MYCICYVCGVVCVSVLYCSFSFHPCAYFMDTANVQHSLDEIYFVVVTAVAAAGALAVTVLLSSQQILLCSAILRLVRCVSVVEPEKKRIERLTHAKTFCNRKKDQTRRNKKNNEISLVGSVFFGAVTAIKLLYCILRRLYSLCSGKR